MAEKKAAKRGDNTQRVISPYIRVLVYRYVRKPNGALGLRKAWEWRDRNNP